MTLRAVLPLIAIAVFVASGCGTYPPSVKSAEDIQELSVTEPSVSARELADSDIPALARLKYLRFLDFACGEAVMPARITDAGLAELAKVDLPNLETLSLGYCDNITGAGLAHVARMETITWLALTSCPNVTDAGLLELVNSKSLTGLDLRGCPNVSDDGILQLAAKPDWQTIWLGGCPRITPEGVARLQAALPNARVEKDDREWEYHSFESRYPRWRRED